MTWFLARQYRLSGAVTVGLLAAFAVLLATTGSQIRSRYDALLTCSSGCLVVNQMDVFRGFDAVILLVHLTIAVPLLLGVFWGATVLAREFEAGTHVLSWTQGQTRRRWVAAQLALAVGVAVLWGAVTGALISWWSGPLNALRGDGFEPGKFDGQGVVPMAYTVFTVALGLAAGAAYRRVVPALAVTVAGFAGMRLLVTLFLRQRFQSPVTATVSPDAVSTLPTGSWILGTEPVTGSSALTVTYQPPDRFWTFQLVEAGIFVALAAVLLAVAWWAVRRRDA